MKNKFLFKNKIARLGFSVVTLTTSLVGCRGDKSSEPPILIIRNMVDQTSYAPQSKNDFYKDSRAARPAVEGTVAENEANTNKALYEGIEPGTDFQEQKWVKKFPLNLTADVLKNGQKQYNVYCSPCHGYSGNNDGLATQAAGGTIHPANIHDKEKLNLPVGRIYSAITNGVNNWNMPGFSEQMSVQDRWAVVAYVRALQLSQHTPISYIPENQRK